MAYWEAVEPEIGRAVRGRLAEFREAGITGIDLYLAAHGPALEVFSRRCPYRKPRIARRDGGAAEPGDACRVAEATVTRWLDEEAGRHGTGG